MTHSDFPTKHISNKTLNRKKAGSKPHRQLPTPHLLSRYKLQLCKFLIRQVILLHNYPKVISRTFHYLPDAPFWVGHSGK